MTKQSALLIDKVYPTEKYASYQWIYLLGVAVTTGIILNNYVFHINQQLGFEHDWMREYYICFGQIFWQLGAILLIDRSKTSIYLGTMSTVSLIGGILLLPVLLINYMMPLSVIVMAVYFALVVGFMFFEHIRRCKMLGLPLWMTFSWVMYRTIVLGIMILILF